MLVQEISNYVIKTSSMVLESKAVECEVKNEIRYYEFLVETKLHWLQFEGYHSRLLWIVDVSCRLRVIVGSHLCHVLLSSMSRIMVILGLSQMCSSQLSIRLSLFNCLIYQTVGTSSLLIDTCGPFPKEQVGFLNYQFSFSK